MAKKKFSTRTLNKGIEIVLKGDDSVGGAANTIGTSKSYLDRLVRQQNERAKSEGLTPLERFKKSSGKKWL